MVRYHRANRLEPSGRAASQRFSDRARGLKNGTLATGVDSITFISDSATSIAATSIQRPRRFATRGSSIGATDNGRADDRNLSQFSVPAALRFQDPRLHLQDRSRIDLSRGLESPSWLCSVRANNPPTSSSLSLREPIHPRTLLSESVDPFPIHTLRFRPKFGPGTGA